MNLLNNIASRVLDLAHDYGDFKDLEKTGDSLGEMLSSLVSLVQTYIWIPAGFVALLGIICFIGGRRGKEWAMGKFKDVLIVIGCLIFFVYLLTAILSAFGYNTDSMTNIFYNK